MIAHYELALVALASPFLLFPNRLTGFAFGLLVITWLSNLIARGRLSVRTRLDVPIALLLLMTLVGMFASIDLAVSWPKFWGVMLGIAIYHGLVNGLKTEQQVLVMGLILLMTGTVAALFSLFVTDWQSFQYYDLTWITNRIPTLPTLARALPTGGVPRWSEALGTGVLHPREVGGTMGMVVPIALALFLFGRGMVVKGIAGLGLLTMGFIAVLAQALTALAGIAVSVIVITLWRFRRLSIVVFPMMLVSTVIGRELILSALNPDNEAASGVVERFAIWLWGLEALRHEPLTGVGLNSFDYVLSGMFPLALFPGVVHAHNVFLQIALDVGIPGLLAFLWLLFALAQTIRAGLRHAEQVNTRVLLVGIAAGIISYITFGTMDTITLGAKPAAAFWAMLGLAGALTTLNKQSALIPTRSFPIASKGIILSVVGLACVALLVAFGGAVSAIGYLNLGTLQAHKALAQARIGEPVPVELMQSARQFLKQAQEGGQTTVHTYELLASINGWLADCAQAVHSTQRSVLAGGEQAVGSQSLVAGNWPLLNSSVNAPYEPLRRTATSFAEKLQERLSLPRTMDMQLNRYRLMLDVVVTRLGSFSTWWEPYLRIAIISNEHYHNPEYAQQVLQKGVERARYKAPLGCYRPEP
ncbi:MAG: O-antigen ligase family protein [Chloroflexi bacterium]|nr:O-antigen ligase family protein [Chloroflexota bacterium]